MAVERDTDGVYCLIELSVLHKDGRPFVFAADEDEAMVKPFKTIHDQLNLLKDRGFVADQRQQ